MKRFFNQKVNEPVGRRSVKSDVTGSQYTRSRTISAYTPQQPANDMSRLSVHELRRHRTHLVRTLVGSLAIVSILLVIVTQFTARIGSLSYSPAPVTQPDATVVRAAVDDYYASRPLERIRFLLNKQTFSQFLVSKVPEVKGVETVSGDGIGSSRLSLDLRTPVASWNTGGSVVYVDENGESFTHNYYAPPTVSIEDQSGAASPSSSTVASSTMIRYIGQLIATLQSNGTGTVSKVVLPAGMIRELDVYLQGRVYFLKVQLDRDVSSQAADAKTAVTYINGHGGAKQYIDVRVEGKAFYK